MKLRYKSNRTRVSKIENEVLPKYQLGIIGVVVKIRVGTIANTKQRSVYYLSFVNKTNKRSIDI